MPRPIPKPLQWAGLVSALLLVAGCASTKPEVAEPSSPDPGAIASALQKSVAGWNEADLDAFIAIYAENATFATQDRFVRGKAAIRELYAPAFTPGTTHDSLSLEKIEVETVSPELVLVRSIYNNNRNGVVTRRGTTTLLMRLIDGNWRVVHDHSS